MTRIGFRRLSLNLSAIKTGYVILCSACMLALPSILNGFPFLFNDSGFYILSSRMQVSEAAFLWRPLTYSLLLNTVFGVGSFLFRIFMQNLFLAVFLFYLIKLIDPKVHPKVFFIALLAMTLTPLIWYSNFIMPDIFAGIMILSLSATAYAKAWYYKAPWLFIYLLSTATHYSNIVIGSLLFLFVVWTNGKRILRHRLAILLLPWLIVLTVHFYATGTFIFSNSANIFIYSQLSSLGVAQEYLHTNCSHLDSGLCLNQDLKFNIWDRGPGSFIGKAGGLRLLQEDIAQANYEILTSPLAIKALGLALNRVLSQLVQFSTPIEPMIENSYLKREVEMYSAKEARNMEIQNLTPGLVNKIMFWVKYLYFVVIVLSLGSLAYLYRRRKLQSVSRLFLKIAIAGYLLNAIVCGLLTDPMDRYSGRIIWIFPLILIFDRIKTMGSEFLCGSHTVKKVV